MRCSCPAAPLIPAVRLHLRLFSRSPLTRVRCILWAGLLLSLSLCVRNVMRLSYKRSRSAQNILPDTSAMGSMWWVWFDDRWRYRVSCCFVVSRIPVSRSPLLGSLQPTGCSNCLRVMTCFISYFVHRSGNCHHHHHRHDSHCVVAFDAFRTLVPLQRIAEPPLIQCLVTIFPIAWRHLPTCHWMNTGRRCCFERSSSARTPVVGDFDFRADWSMIRRLHCWRFSFIFSFNQ